jgi:hypothetical protein
MKKFFTWFPVGIADQRVQQKKQFTGPGNPGINGLLRKRNVNQNKPNDCYENIAWIIAGIIWPIAGIVLIYELWRKK